MGSHKNSYNRTDQYKIDRDSRVLCAIRFSLSGTHQQVLLSVYFHLRRENHGRRLWSVLSERFPMIRGIFPNCSKLPNHRGPLFVGCISLRMCAVFVWPLLLGRRYILCVIICGGFVTSGLRRQRMHLHER